MARPSSPRSCAARPPGSFEIEPAAARLLARGSRDTPREALGLLAAVRDQVELDGWARIDEATARTVLESLEIDSDGLGRIDREYLAALRRAGRPLSLATLADRLGKSRGAIQRVHEPFLIRRGLIVRTPAGRRLAS
jgi:Holliday junction DNA helicase RuvB